MEVHVQNLVYTNTFLVQSISLWNQVFRDTGPFFLSKKWEKTLWKQKATELQSYNPSLPGMRTILFFCKKKWKKVTELQSYRVTGHPYWESGIQSYRATELREPFFFHREKKLQSYRVTELQGYRHQIFFGRKKNHDGRKKKLQSYRVTELQASIFFQRKPSYKATTKVTKLRNFVTFKKKGLLGKSYRVTELQGYRHQFFFQRKKNFGIFFQRKKVTKLQEKLQSYVTSYLLRSLDKKLQSYRVTELQSYRTGILSI